MHACSHVSSGNTGTDTYACTGKYDNALFRQIHYNAWCRITKKNSSDYVNDIRDLGLDGGFLW